MTTIKYMLCLLVHNLSRNIFLWANFINYCYLWVATTCTYEKYINYKNIELSHHQLHWEWLTHPITENGYIHFRRFDILSQHQLQDALRMAYPPHHWEWIHPVQAFQYIKSSSAVRHTENGLPTPPLRMDTPISGVSTY